MNTPDDFPEDEVTRAYQRAGEAETGPAPATRAAILAEARAANLRRTPAANQSRYAWRAVAGIAVMGVAVLLWRQSQQQVSQDLTVASSGPGEAAADAPRSQVAADASEEAAGPAAKAEMNQTRAPVLRERETKRSEETGGADVASVAAPAAPSLERASADAAPAFSAGAARQDVSDHQDLLQQEFPEVWRDEKAATTVWMVMAADGSVASKGVLSGADTLASVTTGAPGSWARSEVKTASGNSLQLAVRNLD